MDRGGDLPAVVVGSSPPESGGEPWHPLAGSSVGLARGAGCAPADLRLRFGLANLLGAWEGGSPSRDELFAAGRSFALLPGFRYVLAGQLVVRALGPRAMPARRQEVAWAVGGGPPLLTWYEARCGLLMAVLPHPSGRNRWYNLAGRRSMASSFLRACAWAGPGPADDLWLEALLRAWIGGRTAEDPGGDEGATERVVAAGLVDERTWRPTARGEALLGTRRAAGDILEDPRSGEVVRVIGRQDGAGVWVERLRCRACPEATPGMRCRDVTGWRRLEIPSWRDPDGTLVDGRWLPERPLAAS